MKKSATAWIAAALVAAATIVPAPPIVDAIGTHDIVFVSASDGLPGGDANVYDHLVASGHAVTVIEDQDVVAADANGRDLVIISTTVSPSLIGTEFLDADVPVLTWERSLYDDMEFITSGGQAGETPRKTEITVVDDVHPIAAGLSGTFKVSTKANGLSYGRVGASADVVATEIGSLARPTIFAFESGAPLADGRPAAARRVGFFFSYNTAKHWTADARTLFDGAIEWAANSAPPVNAPPVVDAGDDQLILPAATAELEGIVDDDGIATPLTTTWTGPAGVTFVDPSDPMTEASFTGPGIYTLTLTADDTEFSVADTVDIEVSESAPPEPPSPPQVLWITNKDTPPSNEVPAIDRLTSQGMIVTVQDDDKTVEADTEGVDVVVVTTAISAGRFDAWYETLDIPMLVWEPFVYDDLGFVSGSDTKGQASSFNRIDIEDPDHPVAGGFTGSPTVLTSNQSMTWATPFGDADIIATLDNSTSRAAIFTYDDGAMMDTAPAPARRTGFFLGYTGPTHLSTDGWAIWDAAIDWTLNGYPPVHPPIAALTADDAGATAPAVITFDASGSADPDGDIVGYDWDFGDGGTDATTIPTVDHTYVDAGTFSVSVVVTDSLGATDSATFQVTVSDGELPPGWAKAGHDFRTRITVAAAGVDRADRPVVAPIDFTDLLAEVGAVDEAFDPASLVVVEVASDDTVLTDPVPFQFDPDPFFEPATRASGELVFILDGSTPGATERYFDVYFDVPAKAHTAPVFPALVDAVTGGTDQGLAAIKFETAVGDWWFDETGGGFISLDDVDGNDWISWSSANGAAGEFRGIPNAVHPEGYFHPGDGLVTSTLTASGPIRATVDSTVTAGGGYRTRWHVYPTFAEMTMLQAAGPFWFLYEGTPGGTLDVATDTVVLSDGTSILAGDSFVGDIVGDEWAYFTDEATNRSLYVAHLDGDAVADTYKDLNDIMTVWGFGRGSTTETLMTDTPNRFIVGLTDSTSFAPTSATVDSAIQPLAPAVGPTETLLTFPLPPDAAFVSNVTQGDAPLDITFDASASSDPDGTITSYDWDFGDGTTGTGQSVAHTYTDDAFRLATLTVTDNDGLSDVATVAIPVGDLRPDRVTDGLVALYEFEDSPGTTVADTSGFGTPLDLTITNSPNVSWLPDGGVEISAPASIESPGPASKITNAAIASNAMTVEAWVRTSDLTQNGPARIATISDAPNRRNVTLGQGVSGSSGDRIEARFRLSGQGLNGLSETYSPIGSLSDDLTHLVIAHDENGDNLIYIDGELVTIDPETGDFSEWDASMKLLLGAEEDDDGSRSWLGELHLVAFYDRGLGEADVCRNHAAGPGHDIDGFGHDNVVPALCLATSANATEVFQAITFDASGSGDPDGYIANYHWDFGDGTVIDTGVPTIDHAYEAVGTYTATVTLTDDDGDSVSKSMDILVRASSGGRLAWNRIESGDPLLPEPPSTTNDSQQVAAQVGDIDGDGDTDIVLVERGTPGVAIVWYEFVDAATGWVVHTLEDEFVFTEAGGDIYDIDGDGDLDVSFGGGNSSGDIWWWENPSETGPPTGIWDRHTMKSDSATKHHDSRFGDVDGDGEPELVYWNQNPSENLNALFVADRPADPTQLWPSTQIYQAGSASEGLDIADIDGDGTDDIVGGGLWFEREGDGSYTPHVIDPSGGFTRTVVGQLVPGGRPEVVIDSGDAIGPLTVFQWDGSSWVPNVLLDPSTYGHSVRLADFDADGHLDIFSAEMVSPQNTTPRQNPTAATRIFFGDGAGNFELDLVDTGFDHHESRVADLDGDGDIDIVGKPFNIGAPGINVWLNDGPNFFGAWEREAVDESRPWLSLFVEHADVDGDGDDDIVTGGWWYENPGAAAGTWVRHDIGSPMNQMAAIADLDGDGDVDVIGTRMTDTATPGVADFHWAQNDGGGNFTVYPAVDTGDGPFLQGATIGQLTNGGPLEVVLSWNNNSTMTKTIVVPTDLATNPGQGSWATRIIANSSGGEQVVIHDVDEDGDNDVFNGIGWLRQEPADVWTQISIMGPRTNDPDRSVFADMDGDGDDDVVIGFGHGDPNEPDSNLSWFERPDDPTQPWPEHPMSPVINMQSVDVADLDGDGDIDVVAGEHAKPATETARLFLYENVGDGSSFTTHIIHVGDEHHDGTQFTDLDGDGDLDIVSIGFIQPRVVAYYSTAT